MTEQIPLTYRELAERLGMTTDSARIKAKRLKWQKLLPNHPREPIRVLVPIEALEIEPLAERTGGERTPSHIPNHSRLIQALEAHVETLKAAIDRLEDDVERERAERRNEHERAAELERELRQEREERIRLSVEIERLKQPWWRRLQRR